MVEQAEQYRWSSAAVHLELSQDKLRLVGEQFWQGFGGAEALLELLMSPEDLSELRLLRRCTFAGRPYGSEAFLQEMEERFGRKWRRWSFEKTPGERLEDAGGAAGG